MALVKQLNLLKDPRKDTKLWWISKQQVYGGSLNYRKVARPFDSKKLSHTVLKADLGPNLGFNRFQKAIHEIVHRSAKKYGLKIHEWAIHEDHLHLLTFTKSREAQTRFLRFLSAELGRWYARLRRKLGYSARPLWRARPFTRLVSWGRRSRQAVRLYIKRNRAEALGFVAYKPRNHRLNVFLCRWAAPIQALSPPIKNL